LIVLGGALSFVYMFQLYGHRFWVDQPDEGERATTSATARLLVAGIAVAVIALGAWPEPLIALSEQAARSLPERAP
jgi:multicomponent Na+:H+ antiporter subunit D